MYFSYLIFFLFEAVHHHNHSQAYLYCTILSILWYLSILLEHLASNLSCLLAPKIKAGLSMFLYCKITTIKSFSLRTNHLGTVTNLIANDLSTLDERITLIFNIAFFVVGFFGITALITSKIGIIGIVGVIALLLIIPVSYLISKCNGHLINKLTSLKDERIQIST